MIVMLIVLVVVCICFYFLACEQTARPYWWTKPVDWLMERLNRRFFQ